MADTVAVAQPSALRRVSWGAIIAGAIVTIAIQLMLNLLGLGIGLGVTEPGQAGTGIAAGAGIWLVLSTIIAVFLGGWAAGRMAGLPRRADGVLHGFVTWAVATFAAFYLVISGAGALASGAMNVVQQGSQAGGVDRREVQQQVDQMQQRAQELQQQAQQSSEEIMSAVSSGALWGFFALAIGAATGAFGGATGAPKHLLPVSTRARARDY